MAKKKVEEIEGEIQLGDFVTRIRAEINKEFKGTCISAQDVLDRKLLVVPWSKSIDDGIGGGILEGSWVSVSGAKKLGKTSSLLTFAANAQKMGKVVFFMAPEQRLKEMNLKGIEGLDLSSDKLVIIESSKDCILSTQAYLNSAEKIIKSCPGSVIIIDSISALADQKELDEGLGCETRGRNQKVISQFINNNAALVSVNRIILCGIVHLIANTSGYGSPFQEKQPTRWGYQSDYILRAKSSSKWIVGSNDNGEVIGQVIHYECLTSALGVPYTTFDTYLRYGVGLDSIYEYIQAGINCGIISKTGAWYELSFLSNYLEEMIKLENKIPKLQGQENIWKFMKDNKNIFELLRKEVDGIK